MTFIAFTTTEDPAVVVAWFETTLNPSTIHAVKMYGLPGSGTEKWLWHLTVEDENDAALIRLRWS